MLLRRLSMKILFLQLSDLHIKTPDSVSTLHIGKILDALREFGSFDKMILILSGDIAFSGSKIEYSYASSIITTIFREIKSKKIYNDRIEIICVPGNHDISFEDTPRTAEGLQKIYDDYSYESYLPDELAKQKNFFEFAKRNRCFKNKSVFDRKILRINGFKIEVNMINSSIFSLKDDEDKGMHYIDQTSINELNTPTNSDFVISVMHHAPEWYIDSQKNQIEPALLCKSSLIFMGHEHVTGIKNCSYDNKASAFIHAGGSLCNDSDWSKSEFEVGLLDTTSNKYDVKVFSWNSSAEQYEPTSNYSKTLPQKPSIEKKLAIQEDFANNLFSNSHRAFSNSSKDYFVFPRIESETYEDNGNKEFLNMDGFVEEIIKEKRVLLTGSNNSGKSALLKMLFLKLNDLGKCVILCDIDTIRRKDSSKIVKTNFEDIYGSEYSDYIRFLQLPPENKVLIVDDIDQIKQKDFEDYISGISDQFGVMIFATKDVIDLDMAKRMETALKTENSVSKYKIMPFFADKRKELVHKLVTLRNQKDPSIDVSETVETLCASIKLQKKYINLDPEFIISFVDYYCNNIGSALNNDSSVFSKVFEANITNSLFAHKTRELTIEKLYKLLSMLAHYIHFNKKYPVSESDIIEVVNNYNTEFDDVIRPLAFLETIKNAKILISEDGGYRFANKNQLAYFCAREVNFKYHATSNEDDLKYLVKYCCFGINADILMFISYITDNTRILQLFLNMTLELTSEWKEFDFNNNCPNFLKNSGEQEVLPPTPDNKKQYEAEEVKTEREANNMLQTIDIYDYEEDDVEKTINQIIRSLSLLTIISKCLPSFEHNMNADMRKQFVGTIYELPNKIYNRWAEEVDQIYGELVEYLKEQEQVEYQNQGAKNSDNVELKFKLVASMLLLDIYNIAVNFSTKDNSFRLLDNYERNGNLTYELQHLMMLERQQLADKFVDQSIHLHEHCDQNLPKFLIKNVVKHAYITMRTLDFKKLARLKSTIFQIGHPGKRTIIPEQKTLLIKRNKNKQKGE